MANPVLDHYQYITNVAWAGKWICALVPLRVHATSLYEYWGPWRDRKYPTWNYVDVGGALHSGGYVEDDLTYPGGYYTNSDVNLGPFPTETMWSIGQAGDFRYQTARSPGGAEENVVKIKEGIRVASTTEGIDRYSWIGGSFGDNGTGVSLAATDLENFPTFPTDVYGAGGSRYHATVYPLNHGNHAYVDYQSTPITPSADFNDCVVPWMNNKDYFVDGDGEVWYNERTTSELNAGEPGYGDRKWHSDRTVTMYRLAMPGTSSTLPHNLILTDSVQTPFNVPYISGDYVDPGGGTIRYPSFLYTPDQYWPSGQATTTPTDANGYTGTTRIGEHTLDFSQTAIRYNNVWHDCRAIHLTHWDYQFTADWNTTVRDPSKASFKVIPTTFLDGTSNWYNKFAYVHLLCLRRGASAGQAETTG